MDEAFIKVLSKYTSFTNVFLPKLAEKFPSDISISNYVIELVSN